MPKKSRHWYLNPIDQIKASLRIGLYRFQNGRVYNPFGMFQTANYVYHNYWLTPKPPTPPGLEVATTESDRQGFAIYGTVRVSGTSVIP